MPITEIKAIKLYFTIIMSNIIKKTRPGDLVVPDPFGR